MASTNLKCGRHKSERKRFSRSRLISDAYSTRLLPGLTNAFAAGVKLCRSDLEPQETINTSRESLEEIFQILIHLGSPADPVVLCAFYIALINNGSALFGQSFSLPGHGQARESSERCFGERVSKLEHIECDRMLQELSAAARIEGAAATVLEVALDHLSEGYIVFLLSNRRKRNPVCRLEVVIPTNSRYVAHFIF